MSSIVVNAFFGILIDGGCVSGPATGFLLPDTELGPDVGNKSSKISSNFSDLNGGLKCRLLMLSQMRVLYLFPLIKYLRIDLKLSSFLGV